jgi:P4 family phage/plasmid primase-like protien
MSAAPVATADRFTASHPCPICSGHQGQARGRGVRCAGFKSADDAVAFCSRIESPKPAGGAFRHFNFGPCDCGVTHRPWSEAPPEIRERFERRVDRGADPKAPKPWTMPTSEIETTHAYTDPSTGVVLFEIVRTTKAARERGAPKTLPRHLVDGRWLYGAGPWAGRSDELPLYREAEVIAELQQGGVAHLVEGERDADRIHEAGGVAACNAWGAGKFRERHARTLAAALHDGEPSAELIVVADRDDEGARHVAVVREKLAAAGAPLDRVRFVQPRTGKDAADHLEAGHGLENFEPFTLADAAQLVSPDDGVIEREADEAAHLTDAGNAERLVHQHGLDLHHVHAWNRWLVYDGSRWKTDGSGEIVRRAKATVRAIYGEAKQADSDGERKAIAAWAARSESASRIDAMISLARSEPGIPVEHEQLDRDPWAFNVMNGTVDLRTGELRDHDRADLATKLAPVTYDPQATTPTWERFLARIIPDAAVRAFLRRAVGYSLTGNTGEQVLFLLCGSGANGKTTFIETVLAMLGDYSMKTPADTLLARREGAIPNDVAALRGARFVAAVESEENRRLAEVRVKELTGGDTVSARFMRAEWFTFTPVCKLWLATNHRPSVRGTDEAIWRRIRLVPFDVTIPEAERDRTLLDRLRAEQAGILAWAVAGAVEWHRDGLRAPPAVQMATSAYRAEQDVLGAFLADRCVISDAAWVSSAALYAAYCAWADATGETAMKQRALGLALAQRGFEDARTGKSRTRGWRGIGLLDDREGSEGGHMADATA